MDSPTLNDAGMTAEEAARHEDATEDQSGWWQFGYIVGQRVALRGLARTIERERRSFDGLRPLEDLGDG